MKPGDAREAAAHAAKMLNDSKTERHDFEYGAAKLKRVVEAAMLRAREEGKPDLADSVHLLYEESLQNMDLRVLLEKTLTQRTTPEEIKDFQDYVRAAKRKLKQHKAKWGPKFDVKDAMEWSSAVQVPMGDSRTGKPTDVSKTLKAASTTTTTRAASKTGTSQPVGSGHAAGAKASSRTQPPKAVIAKIEEPLDVKMSDTVRSAKAGPSCSAPNRLDSHHATEDSGYGSEQTGDKADNGSAKDTTPSEEASTKRKTMSTTSSEEAEREDFEEARRASKRRRREGSDDSGSYHPSADEGRRTKSKRRRSRNETHEQTASDSSPLSDPPEEDDIEQAKEAYVDEMVRRKTAEESRQAIEDQYGPVSPSVVDARSEPTESWDSMPSPTMEPAKPAEASQPRPTGSEEQAIVGAQNDEAQANTAAVIEAPAPAPEGFTAAEEANAYKLITATVSEAIIPYFKHVETKLDKLEDVQKSLQSAPKTSIPSSEELLSAAKAIQSGSLQAHDPEVTQLISQLLKNAAEASIHAAEAARKAGEVARDVSQVLMHISSNNENEPTPRTSQRSQRKKN